ncbi:MAG: GIY-YIG nuclease family protein [Planctomycetota bacterium]
MIYFIATNDCVKIGYTDVPNGRFSQLQTSSPDKLEMLLLLSGDRETESDLHTLFRDLRLSGEWFSLAEPIKKYIEDNREYDRRYEFNFVSEDFDCNQQILRIRKQEHLTGAELGKRLGVNRQRISRIEKDEARGRVTLNTLKKCATALGYELEYRLIKKVDNQ